MFANIMIIDITNISKNYGNTTFLDRDNMETEVEDDYETPKTIHKTFLLLKQRLLPYLTIGL